LPRGLEVPEVHLGESDNVYLDAWRAAFRLFAHTYGRLGELASQAELPRTIEVRSMTREQRRADRARSGIVFTGCGRAA
jgi:hypothetical protein